MGFGIWVGDYDNHFHFRGTGDKLSSGNRAVEIGFGLEVIRVTKC